jgi:hypothetical protein
MSTSEISQQNGKQMLENDNYKPYISEASSLRIQGLRENACSVGSGVYPLSVAKSGGKDLLIFYEEDSFIRKLGASHIKHFLRLNTWLVPPR